MKTIKEYLSKLNSFKDNKLTVKGTVSLLSTISSELRASIGYYRCGCKSSIHQSVYSNAVNIVAVEECKHVEALVMVLKKSCRLQIKELSQGHDGHGAELCEKYNKVMEEVESLLALIRVREREG